MNRNEKSKYGIPIMEAYVTNLLITHDVHFKSYEKACKACMMNYNAIVKTDDLSEVDKFFLDSDLVDNQSQKLYRKSDNTIQNRSVKKADSSWKAYFKGVRPQTWIKLLQFYRKDFEHFGYNLYYCRP